MESRKTTIELLWARAPEAEAVRRLAGELGVEKPRFAGRDDLGRCILCGLCVRVCDKLIGASALCFARRGVRRRVGTPFDSASPECIGCNACAAVCPTGHIVTVDKGPVRHLETWKTSLEMVLCDTCGTAYLPLKEFEHIRAKLGPKTPLEKTCPNCARRRAAGRLEEAAGKEVAVQRQTLGI
jgi:ferredoxin